MNRILITGSRTWTDKDTIMSALREVEKPGENVLVSGACPTGADRLGEEAAKSLGWTVELHPAEWNTHTNCPAENPGNGTCWQGRSRCKRAGFVRNAKMVNLGADTVIAFIRDGSNGATMTANLALKAGLELIKYEI
jgi:hypothetical protein